MQHYSILRGMSWCSGALKMRYPPILKVKIKKIILGSEANSEKCCPLPSNATPFVKCCPLPVIAGLTRNPLSPFICNLISVPIKNRHEVLAFNTKSIGICESIKEESLFNKGTLIAQT